MWQSKAELSQIQLRAEIGEINTSQNRESREGRESWKRFGLFSIKTKMSASEQMRAMLDQLMGTSRNGESFYLDKSKTVPGF